MNVMTDIAAGLTRALSEQARTLTFADLPANVRTLARQSRILYATAFSRAPRTASFMRYYPG